MSSDILYDRMSDPFLLCKVLSPVAVCTQLALAQEFFPVYVRICAEHPTCGRAIAGRSVSIDGESGLGVSFFAHIPVECIGNELPPSYMSEGGGGNGGEVTPPPKHSFLVL